MEIEDTKKKARRKRRPRHPQSDPVNNIKSNKDNNISTSSHKAETRESFSLSQSAHTPPPSAKRKEKKQKRSFVKEAGEKTQTFKNPSSELGQKNEQLVSLKKRKNRKRKRSKSSLIDPEKQGELLTVNSSENDSAPSVVSKKKRKRKNLKQNSVNSMENNSSRILTNGNYPKEHSTTDGFSSNWKKLCQQLIITKSTKDTNGEHQVTNLKPSVVPKTQQKPKPAMNEIWFDGVDRDLLEPCTKTRRFSKENSLVKEGSFKGLTKAIAMDCEMVGIGDNGTDSMVARVSMVNLMGNCIYDKYVKPAEPVTDFRTAVSGIRPSDLEKGEDFKTVQKEVSDILNQRLLVGHAVHNDLKVLFLTHPKKKIRDTASYKYFRSFNNGNTPSLKHLAGKVLGVKVQEGEHNSVQDAQAAMRLYTMHKTDWEREFKKKTSKRKSAVDASKTKQSSTAKKVTTSPTTKKFSQLKI